MPVNINEFEVVVEPPPTAPSASTSEAAPASQAHGATPYEIENILRREKERLTRVWAH